MVPISIRNITKRFGETVALRNVSLRIEAGELFFMLGPSGCGKTTLLRHIAGFYTPDNGQIFFGDRDVTRLEPHQRNTAMMFQSYALWPHMTVEQNVAFGLEERKVPRPEIEDRVHEALDMVQMGKYMERKVTQLSGGQQQRVALARALVVRPEILLLDEPLSNLDTQLRLEMRQEIRRICKSFGLTAVYVTHDQKEALSVADRLAVLDGGNIVQLGTPEDMYRNPRSAFLASFMGETNFIPGQVEGPTSRQHLWSVATAAGRFWGRVPVGEWQPAPGEPVTLSIRPEALTLAPFRELRNCVAGSLTRATYLGEYAQYEVKTDKLGLLRLSEPNPRKLHPVDGPHVNVLADPEDVVLLKL